MSRRLEFTPLARRDLRRIVLFIGERNKDFLVARNFGRRLISRCRDLPKAPHSGAPVSGLDGVRKVVEGSYKIFYRVTDEKIVILRIWDGRRGHDPLL